VISLEKLNNDDAIDNDILVNEVKKKICSNDIIHNLAFFYKIMGDNTRLNLLMVLEFGELCVSDLAYLLNMSISAVSHQLKILRNAKLVKIRRDGKNIYYSLDDDHIKSILEVSLEHILER
jgi:ArsR family transcriptional regulator